MEFEDLQAIWDTPNEKPVLAMFMMLVVIGELTFIFRSIDALIRRFKGRFTHNGFGMGAWDYAGLAVAAAAILALVIPLYLERKKHERAQKIFAPTLRAGPTRLHNKSAQASRCLGFSA